MKTKDELFPPPINPTLFLWVGGWEETEPGEGVWECEAADEGDANYGLFDTDDALRLAHDFIDLLIATEPKHGGLDETLSDNYFRLLETHDADFREESALQKRINSAIAEGILPAPNGQRMNPPPAREARQLCLIA